MDPKFVEKLVTERSFDARGALIPEGHIGTFDENKLNGKEPHLFDPSGNAPVLVAQSAIAPTGPNPTMPQQIPPDAVQGPGGDYMRPGVILVAERTMDADQRLAGRLKEGDTSEGDLQEELRRMAARAGEIRGLLEAHRQNAETAVRAELASVQTGAGPTMAELMDRGPADESDTVKELRAEIERLKADKTPPPPPPGTGAGGEGTIEADQLIEGTVKVVTAELGTKTDDQLAAMQKAEKDREQPRKGVLGAIETELAARAEKAKSA